MKITLRMTPGQLQERLTHASIEHSLIHYNPKPERRDLCLLLVLVMNMDVQAVNR